MHPRRFDEKITRLQDAGLDIHPDEFSTLARMADRDLDLMLRLLVRAMVSAAAPNVVRYRTPATCSERLAADHTPSRGRHASPEVPGA